LIRARFLRRGSSELWMHFGKSFPWKPALMLAVATLLTQPFAMAQQPPAEAPKAEAPKAAPAPTPSTPAPSTPPDQPAPSPSQPAPGGVSGDHPPATTGEDASVKTVEVAARSVIETHGAASWEEGYGKIGDALAKLRAAALKAGLKENGRPLTVFTETDDAGFKFDAMLPVDAPAGAKPDLGSEITLTQSPSGKAIKFEHRGAYDDIDSTYEAITAYLDEKGLEARNLFIEEYLNDAKDSTDVNLQVDIFVLLK
jgi:effector-binding domain-containing protein